MNVAILGASQKPERYSYKALKMLREHDHSIYPVHPTLDEIEGHRVYPALSEIDDEIHTLTVYVSPKWIGDMIPQIIEMKPRRVILNPGTESDELKMQLKDAGIPYLEACTLVLLRTGQFPTAK